MHQRARAFGGSGDGQAYTVSTFVDGDPDPAGRYGAALLFIRWSEAGDRPVGHVGSTTSRSAPIPTPRVAPLLDLSPGRRESAPRPPPGGHSVTSGVVLARAGSTYRVHVEGREIVATLRGKLKHRDDDRVVVGDIVEMEMETPESGAITGIRERRTVLARRAAGQGAGRAQPIAANVDQVLVVAAARGIPEERRPRMIDRFLVIAEANHLPSLIVVNKVELDRDAGAALVARFQAALYPVLLTSVKTNEGLGDLEGHLRGRETVLAGQSGVGKSSLLSTPSSLA